ncbi:MAG TPA: response regulator [Gemmatimonadales bacterium]
MPIEDSQAEDAPPVILIANDQEWTARAVESILAASGYKVTHAYTARETLRLAAETDPDLVILDQQLPDFSGLEVCQQLRANPQFGSSLPIIITTAGPSGRPQRLNAYAAGAWEFYGQPLDSEALLHKLGVYLAAYRDTRRLRRCAMIEEESGLYTRWGLARRATELIGDAKRLGRAVGCVGWSILSGEGTPRIPEAVVAFRGNARSADAFGRLASGDFVAVVPGATSDGAERMADRFRELLAHAAEVAIERVRSNVVVVDDPALLPSDGDQLVDRMAHALAG